MKIAIYGKTLSERLPSFLKQLIGTLTTYNCNILLNKFLYDVASEASILPDVYDIYDEKKNILDADVLLSIGGDGTLLDTISIIGNSAIPVLGINLGRLGFISSIPIEHLEQAIADIINKNYKINHRTLLKVSTTVSKLEDSFNYALNEAAIQKKDSSSMITIHTYINEQFLNSYWADGLIIATPTGSTAYSLSCGGPILTPDAHNLVITPIAPHNLAVRPVVIPDNSIIKMKLSSRSAGFWISLDSRHNAGQPGDEIIVRKADYYMNFIELINHSFFASLRNKLLWGRDIRN